MSPAKSNPLTFQELILRLPWVGASGPSKPRWKRLGVQAVVSTLGCLSAFVPAVAQSRPDLIVSLKTIMTQEQLNEWMMHYYQHPRSDLTVSAVEFMAKSGELANKGAQAPIGAFLGQVFIQNPQKVEPWFSQLKNGEDNQKQVLALALWIANTEAFAHFLQTLEPGSSPSVSEYVKGLLATRSPDLLTDEVTNAGFLDMLWGSFFATGDERYVRRIIGKLPWAKTDNIQQELIGGAAQWSLTSNAAQHVRVLDICKAELSTLPADQKDILASVIKRATEQKK